MDIHAQRKAAEECQDPSRKNFLVAELVSDLFRARGFDPVIVGGSAVEIYSEGRYVSGDVDVCYAGFAIPRPRDRQEILGVIGNSLSSRTWEVAGVMVDLLGEVQTTAKTPFQTIGRLKLIQVEDLIAERILIATYPNRYEERLELPRILLALARRGLIEADMQEVERVAESNDYRVGAELRALLSELA